MQISDLAKQYTSTTSSVEATGGARGVESLVASVRQLTVGNIFEGTVNSIQGGKVVLGLSNGTELAARLEANMQLVNGQSMFFQVKSNDGATIAIRPYMVDGAGANLTLLNALKAANLPVQDKYLNMANTMMQEHMPIDKNSMSQMARILMANPDMGVQTLVQMKKLNLPITTEMASQFENYVDDRAAIHTSFDKFVNELSDVISGKTMNPEQMKTFDSQLLRILADGLDGERIQSAVQGAAEELPQTNASQPTGMSQNDLVSQSANEQQSTNISQNANMSQKANVSQNANIPQDMGDVVQGDEATLRNADGTEQQTASTTVAENTKTIVSDKLLAHIHELFGETGITKGDSAGTMLQKLANYIATGENVTGESLEQLFSLKDMKKLLKDVLQEQLFLEPEEVADGDKLKKLYDRLDSKTQAIEQLLQQTGLKDTQLAQTISDVRGNIEFMNQLNQIYTYTQIPLRMHNQDASGQLYVYTSKHNLDDPERDLTAFLHLDLEHLGTTDVSIRMHKKEVSTKFYMDSDVAYDLVKMHMPQLEERLRNKGYNCKIEVANEGQHVSFLNDFLKKDAPSTGQLHRYSFDVRA